MASNFNAACTEKHKTSIQQPPAWSISTAILEAAAQGIFQPYHRLEIVETVLKSSMNFVTFDFAGCGKSEGAHISLGSKEHLDVKSVVDHLRREWAIERIVLWGRSMGAVAAIHYEAEVQACVALVLDSPFADF